MPIVTIQTADGEECYEVRSGLGFQALATRQKTRLEFDCRAADCGVCILRVLTGAENLSVPTVAERDFLQAMRADSDERLACQVRILGDVTVLVADP